MASFSLVPCECMSAEPGSLATCFDWKRGRVIG